MNYSPALSQFSDTPDGKQVDEEGDFGKSKSN
jgi:hypothetical protein